MLMKSLIYMLSLLFSLVSVQAQTGSLKGIVVDGKGKPVAFSTVLIYEEGEFVNGARANEKGEFLTPLIETGNYVVMVKFCNAETTIEDIRVAPNTTKLLEIVLDLSGNEIDFIIDSRYYPIKDGRFIQNIDTTTIPRDGTLKGTVLDQKGQPVAYATVLVYQEDEWVNGARTDEEGEFRVEPLVAGNYVVKLKYIRYELVLTGVIITAGEIKTLDLTLEVENENVEEVVIQTMTFPVLDKDPIPSGATYNQFDKNLWHPAYIPGRQK